MCFALTALCNPPFVKVGMYDRRQEAAFNENSDNMGLVKAVLVAGLYPNVVKVERAVDGGGKGRNGGGGKKPAPPRLKTRKIWDEGEYMHDFFAPGAFKTYRTNYY